MNNKDKNLETSDSIKNQACIFKFKNIFKLLIFFVIIYCFICAYNKHSGGEISFMLNDLRLKIIQAEYDIKDFLNTKRIKNKKGQYLIIPPDLAENKYIDLYIGQFKKSDEYKKRLLYANTADIEIIETEDLNIKRTAPSLIRLKDGRVLVYEYTPALNRPDSDCPEIYNPETKSYKKLQAAPFLFYTKYAELDNGSLLFINKSQITLFDIKTDTFRKAASGIPDADYQMKFALNGSGKLYIILFKSGIKIIELDLVSYTHEIKDEIPDINVSSLTVLENKQLFIIDNSGNIYLYDLADKNLKFHKNGIKLSAASALNDKQLLLTDSKGRLYVYDAAKNNLEYKNEYKINSSLIFYGLKNNKVILMPYCSSLKNEEKECGSLPVQIIDLKNYRVSEIKKNMTIRYCLNLEDKLICENGVIIDENNMYIGMPKFIFGEGGIIGLNNNEVLQLGGSGVKSLNSSRVIRIKKLNENKYTIPVINEKTNEIIQNTLHE